MTSDAEKSRDDLVAEVRDLRRRLSQLESVGPDPPSLANPGQLESRHRAIVDDQRLICRWRPDGTLTFASDALCRYLGRSAAALIGGALDTIAVEADREAMRRHAALLSASNPVEMVECRVVDAAGEVRSLVRVDQAVLDANGAVREIESVARDITEQKRMTAELERGTALVRAFFESASEGIVAVDAGGGIVRANARAEAMFGYAPGELLKQSLEVLVPDRMRSLHRAQRSGYFAEPRPRPMGLGIALAGRRKDGSEFPIEVSLSFVPDEHGGIAMAFVTDISERVLQERQARHLEQLTALGSLAAGIAHEINNPIGIILSRIELMLMDAQDRAGPAEVLEDLRVLHRQAQRLNRITDALLRFGRRRVPEVLPVDLAAIVTDTLLLARYELTRDGIEVLTSFAADLPRVPGDATALQQVFMNLLLNARDAMPQGGTIRIDVGPSADARAVRLTVADAGTGMPADVLAKLGQPFFTTKAHGSGLGLSVSYTIVREHGGHIDVVSEPGVGTTFAITLPRSTADAPAPPEGPPGPA